MTRSVQQIDANLRQAWSTIVPGASTVAQAKLTQALYQERRLPPMKKILDAANQSIRWYEEMDQLMAMPAVDFAYSYMTRTGRVDHAEVRRRSAAAATSADNASPSHPPNTRPGSSSTTVSAAGVPASSGV